MSEDYNVQVSLSLPPAAQYAKGHMLNFRGTTVAEVEEQLDEALRPDSGFVEKVLELGGLLVAGQIAQTGTAPDSSGSGATSSQGEGSFCPHGKRVHKSGSGSRGPWSGMFCPDKVKDCLPVWDKKD